MAKKNLGPMVKRWEKIKGQIVKLEKEKADLRKDFLDEIKKEYPDGTRSAYLEVGKFRVKRSVAAKIVWDLAKLKEIVGNALYSGIIKTKETIDEELLMQKINEDKIKCNDVKKACEVKYEPRLFINLKDNNDEDEIREAREFVELMDF